MIGLFFVFYKQGDLKSETIKNLEKYVHRDDRLPILLNRWGTIFIKTFWERENYLCANKMKRKMLKMKEQIIVTMYMIHCINLIMSSFIATYSNKLPCLKHFLTKINKRNTVCWNGVHYKGILFYSFQCHYVLGRKCQMMPVVVGLHHSGLWIVSWFIHLSITTVYPAGP